ncbi:MAG: natural resistance-associated macrophage protein [Microgenomates group bacterium Gr01-1014_7]|nr:MAG: natural resistance-associated macrophage protein [Microgenomates group bacterium Gr01-1014_7]
MTRKLLKKVAEAPAVALEQSINTSRRLVKAFRNQKEVVKARSYWKTLGPGLTTGAADDDPSGIATYSQAGAGYGFNFLWTAAFTFPFMAIVQEMCARIGLVTGRGLAGSIRLFFPKWVLYTCTLLLFAANSLNIGADLGAMSKATQLLYPNFNFEFLVLAFALFSLALQIFTTYEKYAKYLKWLALVLLAYVFSALSANLNFEEIAMNAVLPSIKFSKDQIFMITAILGTTISPYLFFWQTSQEVEEQILGGRTTLKLREGATDKEISDMRLDVWSGMFLSNLVMFFIIAACGAILFPAGITTITSAGQAAEALRPFAGDFSYLLFAVGIIGTGLLAIPILAGSASYALSESFGWKSGLYRKLKEANAFYGTIIISTLIGLGINFIGFDPIKTLIYSAVINGLIAPVILVLIILLSNSKKVMGERVNNPAITALGWFITLVMIVAGAATISSLLP